MQTKMNTNQNPERKDGIVLSEQSESADLIRFEKMEVQKNYNQKMSNGEYPLYTVLDNAIFRAGNENLRFSYEVKNFEKKETIQGMKFISLLSDVQKHYTEKNKIYYSYKLNPTIEAHLSKYFM